MSQPSQTASKGATRYRFASKGDQKYQQERAAMIRCLSQHNYRCATHTNIGTMKNLSYDAVKKEAVCSKAHPSKAGHKVKPQQTAHVHIALRR